MKVALIAGGWHFPKHFYEKVKQLTVPQGYSVDFIAVCHRNMTATLHQEYIEKIKTLPEGVLKSLDLELYESFADIDYLQQSGWQAKLYENTIGDFFFINQWLDTNPPEYDIYIYLSDDVYLTNNWVNFLVDFDQNTLPLYEYQQGNWVTSSLPSDWVHIGNCPNPGRKVMRSSTGIFTGDFLRKLGRFEMKQVALKRTGKEDNLWEHLDVADWNQVQRNLQDYLETNKLDNKSFRLSNSYRTSKYMVEAERGLLSNTNIFTDSYLNGIKIALQ